MEFIGFVIVDGFMLCLFLAGTIVLLVEFWETRKGKKK